MTDVPALVAWLRDRLDQDEVIAREAMADPGDDGVWEAAPGKERVEGKGIVIYDEGGHDPAQAAHIASWDPAAVLADVDAKRRVLGSLEAIRGTGMPSDAVWAAAAAAFESAAWSLARAYQGRPGWQEGWA